MAEERVERLGIRPKHLGIGFLVAVVVALAVANSDDVTLDYIAGDLELPLFLVIVGAAVIGWIVGWFTGRSRD